MIGAGKAAVILNMLIKLSSTEMKFEQQLRGGYGVE